MGKLRVVGNARKEYTCDIMYIKIDFCTRENNTSQAIDTTSSQCDRFLEIIEKKGFSVENIHIVDYNVSHKINMRDEKFEVNAERKILLRLPYDMKMINFLSDIIKENAFKADIDVSFELSNIEKLHNELIKEAVLDSKKKAEMIAETMGQKVIGINELNAGDRYKNYEIQEREYSPSHMICETNSCSISDKLKAPFHMEDESVEVEWIIE